MPSPGCWLCLKCPPLSDHSPSQHKYFTYPSPKLQITLLLIRRNCSLPWGPTGLCSKLGMAHIMLHYQHFLGTYLALKTRGWFIFGSPGPSIGQVALRGGSHPPAGIHPHPLPPDAPESMAPQGTLAGDQEAHSSRKNKACGQLFHSHHFICSFEYVCVSRSVVSDSSQPHRL